MRSSEPATVSDLVRLRTADSPDRRVLTFDDAYLTYADWDARADLLANRLLELGVARGDTVGVALDTGLDAVVAWVAIACLGAVEVPINPALRGESLAHPMRAAGVRLVVSSGRFLPTVTPVIDEIERQGRLALVDDRFACDSPRGQHVMLRDDPGDAAHAEEIGSDAPSVVLFSSGTTGAPKGVVLLVIPHWRPGAGRWCGLADLRRPHQDAIRRRGENISSWEVEQAIARHPAVLEVCAVGVLSAISGEEVLVVVVVSEDVAPEALLQQAEDQLPHYAVPRYVRFVNDLPKTQSARTEKYKLRAEGVTSEAWDREIAGLTPRRSE